MIRTEYLNPIEMIPHHFKVEGIDLNKYHLAHLKFDAGMDYDYDYRIIRESTHDGTFLFTNMLIGEALLPLVKRTTYCKKDNIEDRLDNLIGIDYSIGHIRLETELVGGRSIRNIVTIPVRCEYTFNQ